MRAVLHAGSGQVQVSSVCDPELAAPTDAIVRVRRAAVCGTDLHLVAHADDLPRGTIMGHEFVGDIVAVGSAVHGHQVDDLVVGADFTACGHCWWCRRGDHWECAQRQFFGTGTAYGPALAGAQADLVRVPFADTVLRKVPSGVGLDAAVFLGDTLATGFVAIERAMLRPGDTVAVVGGGPIGQLTSLVAQACGAGVVVVIEPVPARRQLAAAEGALTAAPAEAGTLLDGVTDGRGADAVIDAIGGHTGLETSFALVRRRGTIVSVGVQGAEPFPMPAQRAFADEVTLRFAIGDIMRDGDAITALVRSGAVDPTVIASEVVALEEVPDAYHRMADRRTLKTLVTI